MAIEFTSHFIETTDKSSLHYYSIGTGPGVLIVHGAATYALSHEELARGLASFFTVHLVSRRGRGLSGDYPQSLFQGGVLRQHLDQLHSAADHALDAEASYTIHTGDRTFKETYHPTFKGGLLAVETADLEAVIDATGSRYIVGVSSGALTVLRALCSSSPSIALQRVKKFIIFEPPIIFEDQRTSCKIEGINRYEADLAQHKELSALVTAMHTVELGPTWIPRRLMEIISWLMLRVMDNAEARRRAAGGDDRGKCLLRDMAGLIRYDFALVEAMLQRSDNYDLSAQRGEDILLLSGAQTTAYIQEAMTTLRRIFPTAKSIVVEGVGHELLVNAEMRGQSAKAVDVIRDFFR
ncbi:hypothetical protein HJFPF1_05677 [Paramyrothecium foliicola]|nr:hypothetical protein HJFPF1_05677 [Paramyrothecium foliicola]